MFHKFDEDESILTRHPQFSFSIYVLRTLFLLFYKIIDECKNYCTEYQIYDPICVA